MRSRIHREQIPMLIHFFPPPIPQMAQHHDAASIVHGAWIWLAWHRSSWTDRCIFAPMIDFCPAYILTAGLLDVAILGQRVTRASGKSRLRQLGAILRSSFTHGLF